MSARGVRRLLAVAVGIAVLTLAGFWLAHRLEEREACAGTSASLCKLLHESDQRECLAGEGCGQP